MPTDLHRIIAPESNLPSGTAWMLADIMESRGKQDMWLRQRPETLAAIRQQAMVHSVESSNRIEGVTVPRERLRPLLLEQSRPRDRSEEELAGYRKAMDWIFAGSSETELAPSVILRLHELAQGGFSGDAGKWKQRDNEIIEIASNGERRIRFRPTSAAQTPSAIANLCRDYNAAIDAGSGPALLAAAWLIFEFLCVHPFRDGNGRVSRLLTTFLLERQGFAVCRYASLERLVEESKRDYYDVLERCSAGWHEGRNEIFPWINYFLGICRRGYRELSGRVDAAGDDGKGMLIRRAALARESSFTLAELHASCPTASAQLVKKVLARMKAAGEARLEGRGRGASWRIVR